jgi:hypothetical protein
LDADDRSGKRYFMKKKRVPATAREEGSKLVCSGRDLAYALRKTNLSSQDALAWRDDLHRARKSLLPPSSKWD